MTAQVARASNPRGTTAMWVRDRLDGLWRDEDFDAWYPRDGRPGLSPAQLATVSVLQFLLNLSDRQAAEAVRCRIDVKYALGLELDDPGFHHSVLSDFRDRLAQDGRADTLLDLVLARLKETGLVKARGRQRTDSTYVLAAVRELTRLELVLEAVRAALEEAARDYPDLLDGLVDEDWASRYGRQVRLVSQPSHPAARLKQAGHDAAELLDCVRTHRPGPAAEALRQIIVQNFLVDARGQLRPRAEKDGLPPVRQRIESPYDLEARYVRRGHRTWTGYLAHVTESCDEGSVNVITDVATTVPTADSTALPGIHARLKRRRLLPCEHLVDGGYVSVALLDSSTRDHRVELVGPVKPGNSWQRKRSTGFSREDFTIDFESRTVTCPTGKVSGNWYELPAMAPYTVVRFNPAHCDPCPVRSSCTSGRAPRTVNFLPRHLHELQTQNRADQHDPQWRRRYARRSGVEGTVNELVNGHQMRRCRYRGVAKAHVQHVFTAIAINIERLSEQEPPDSTYRPRPPTAFQQYLDAHGLPRPRWWRQGQ
ncbi:IS1182 family transposase [Streptomyces sp. H27-D2]|uniref:IS1182 family transposase n=1 Tax=Streptomyces sp. H27-D2 TaxID=3046304 RepID=UPI002DBD3AB7|nr:IS1182 family transposase [Streptomyces sp. H27-D2]MEC4018296.1 IS1182 family transposase [Streptomyces sp. H27-D2]